MNTKDCLLLDLIKETWSDLMLRIKLSASGVYREHYHEAKLIKGPNADCSCC